jgi:hypothetical protein
MEVFSKRHDQCLAKYCALKNIKNSWYEKIDKQALQNAIEIYMTNPSFFGE